MNIISYKRLHFIKYKYTNDSVINDRGVTVSSIVADKEDEIIVPGDGLPKVVPDWVREDPLFELACTDGTCSEITVVPQKRKLVNNEPKVKITGVKVAEDAKPIFIDSDSNAANKAPVREASPVGTSAGKDWPKRETSPDGVIASN